MIAMALSSESATITRSPHSQSHHHDIRRLAHEAHRETMTRNAIMQTNNIIVTTTCWEHQAMEVNTQLPHRGLIIPSHGRRERAV